MESNDSHILTVQRFLYVLDAGNRMEKPRYIHFKRVERYGETKPSVSLDLMGYTKYYYRNRCMYIIMHVETGIHTIYNLNLKNAPRIVN